MLEQIIILDFGSQYTQVIARRVRECNVYSQILSYDTPARGNRQIKAAAASFCPADRRAFMRKTRRCRIKIFSPWRSGSGHLLRRAIVRAFPRRQSRERTQARIRQRHADVKDHPARCSPDCPSAAGLEFARRQAHENARRFQNRRRHGKFRIRRDRKPRAKIFWPAISSRSRAHAARQGNHFQFCPRRLRLRQNWTMRSYVEQAVEEIRAQVGKKTSFLA